jgi:type III secretion protein T
MFMATEALAWIYPLLASIPRLAAAFLLIPLFSRRTVRGVVRNEFILVLALFIYPSASADAQLLASTTTSFAWIMLKEALVGATLGFFLGTILWVAQNVGFLIDLQAGSQNATVFDPLHEHEEGPTAVFMLQFVIVLLLSGGGLLAMLDILFDSCRIWPVARSAPRFDQVFVAGISARADTLLTLTMRFAAPVVVLLLLIELGLGLINRFAEHMDVHALAMPIKSLIATLVLLVFSSFIYDSIRGVLSQDTEVIRALHGVFRGR